MSGDIRELLERLYARYNRREFVHPDPLEFLYRYDSPGDREIAGLVAALLAYGNVRQILRSVEAALDRMGASPRSFVLGASGRRMRDAFYGFRHRFTSGRDVARLLLGARRVIGRYGSLGECFRSHMRASDGTVLPALTRFVKELAFGFRFDHAGFLPSPDGGSACKRLNLYLRWMVRTDEVDPGGWDGIPRSMLVVPLDVHMHRFALRLGLTERRQADMKTALEITGAFRAIEPDDPVKYDFAITRFGIRGDTGDIR